ncbi:MAG: Xaa-Pro peptidase family protein [Gammaproteobacteria bacterium]|nr:Xaa-Pro peptidase family protein [Gammaproteobacteria bacterium]
MNSLTLEQAADVTPVTLLTDTEAQIDMRRLRAYRLQRLREQIIKHDLAAVVLFSPLSIRYASGARGCALFSTHIVSGYLFVPAQGPVILFDHESGQRRGAQLETIDECSPAIPLSYMFGGLRMDEWMTRWAKEMADLVDQYGGGNRRLGIERAGTRTPAAFDGLNIEVADAMDVIEAARNIKSPEEILCMNHAIAVAETGMWRMREALKPGMSEIELWSLLWQANIEHGGDWIECRLLSAGDRTNPWLQEASGRLIRPGELVAFDTDLIGPFGYSADISRTYLCATKPTPYQKELYQRAYDEIHHNFELMQPGMTFKEITEKSFRQPDQFIPTRYPVVAHGIGMSDEWPAILYPQDYPEAGYDGVLERGMTLCVESYVGEDGGCEGVKLEQQILITDNGYKLLTRFPFEDDFLSRTHE